jgi:hypothetical protein
LVSASHRLRDRRIAVKPCDQLFYNIFLFLSLVFVILFPEIALWLRASSGCVDDDLAIGPQRAAWIETKLLEGWPAI